jgi:hypothetical protein
MTKPFIAAAIRAAAIATLVGASAGTAAAGVMTDMSSLYSDINGPGSAAPSLTTSRP